MISLNIWNVFSVKCIIFGIFSQKELATICTDGIHKDNLWTGRIIRSSLVHLLSYRAGSIFFWVFFVAHLVEVFNAAQPILLMLRNGDLCMTVSGLLSGLLAYW